MTTNVMDICCMFFGAEVFNQPLLHEKLDIENISQLCRVHIAEYMFDGANAFYQPKTTAQHLDAKSPAVKLAAAPPPVNEVPLFLPN